MNAAPGVGRNGGDGGANDHFISLSTRISGTVG